jgi:predicted small lipoprotein YifL
MERLLRTIVALAVVLSMVCLAGCEKKAPQSPGAEEETAEAVED